MTDFEAQVLNDLSALKSQMHALLGVGQPGRLHLLEKRVERHERTLQRMKGIGGGLSVLVTLFHLALDLMKR
jgi:predicted nicotinamide N-methyase